MSRLVRGHFCTVSDLAQDAQALGHKRTGSQHHPRHKSVLPGPRRHELTQTVAERLSVNVGRFGEQVRPTALGPDPSLFGSPLGNPTMVSRAQDLRNLPPFVHSGTCVLRLF